MAEDGKSKALLIVVVLVAVGVAAMIYLRLQPREGKVEDFECVSTRLVDVKDTTVTDLDGNSRAARKGMLVVKIRNRSNTAYGSVFAQVVFLKGDKRVGEQGVPFADIAGNAEAERTLLVKEIPEHDKMQCNFMNAIPK